MKKEMIYTGLKLAIIFHFIFLYIELPAQVCTYGLNNPAAQITFGSNPGYSLPAGKTSYSYTSSICPTEGEYTIVNNVSGCFGNSWFVIPVIPANGYMMLINASVNPGIVYTDTISNLCGNANYIFTSSITNVSLPSSCGGNPIRPRFSFTVETLGGTILGSYIGSEVVALHPTGYNVYFRTPSGNGTVVIKITNDVPGGCGNDFTLSDIRIGACGPVVDAKIENAPGVFLNRCAGDSSSVSLFATLGVGYNSPSYQWQIFNGTDWIDITDATSLIYVRKATAATGIFKYRLAVAEADNIRSSNCRILSNEITINVRNPSITGTTTTNSPVCENSTLNLSATGGIAYQWTGPGAFTSAEANTSFKASATSAGEYTVLITDAYGCKYPVSTIVNIVNAPAVVVSNTQSICLGDSVTLYAGGGTAYNWLPLTNLSDAAASQPIAKPISTTRYTVTVTDNNLCSDTASVLVVINTKPAISAGNDKIIIKGQSVTLDGMIAGDNINFSWLASPSLNNIALLNPVVTPFINTHYVLTATSGIGCGISTDTVLVKVYNGLFIPNAFSPNRDGLNDTWQIPALKVFPDALVRVYNRYGLKIFESKAGNTDWDGSYKNIPQPPGIYSYSIDLNIKSPVIKGIVTIVR